MTIGLSRPLDTLDAFGREHDVPLNVVFELTHRCNLQCRHCYVDADTRPELTTAEVGDALQQLADAGSFFVTFTGGEALLRDDLKEILTKARELNFAIRLFTNGTLLDQEFVSWLKGVALLEVGVSVYGATAETHEFVTQVPGSFEASMGGIRLLAAAGIKTLMKCVLMSHNVAEMAEIVALADNIGAIAQFDPGLSPRNNGEAAPAGLQLSPDELQLAMVGDDLPETGDLDLGIPCAAGRDLLCVSPSGKVYPCVQMPYKVGDLRDQAFGEIWYSSPLLAEIRDIRLSDMEECTACALLKYCRQCIGLNLIERGNPTSASPSVCRIAEARRKGAVK